MHLFLQRNLKRFVTIAKCYPPDNGLLKITHLQVFFLHLSAENSFIICFKCYQVFTRNVQFKLKRRSIFYYQHLAGDS